MKSRYTKRVREEAALICAIAASSDDITLLAAVAREIGAVRQSIILASRAWDFCRSTGLPHFDRATSCRIDAEAEALIRTGWSPE